MSLARITHTQKKSLHTFHEEPFFINCKNPCRFRNTVSIYCRFGSQRKQLIYLVCAPSCEMNHCINFMQFLANILPNNRFLRQTQGLAPLCLGNPGSTTDLFEYILMTILIQLATFLFQCKITDFPCKSILLSTWYSVHTS